MNPQGGNSDIVTTSATLLVQGVPIEHIEGVEEHRTPEGDGIGVRIGMESI